MSAHTWYLAKYSRTLIMLSRSKSWPTKPNPKLCIYCITLNYPIVSIYAGLRWVLPLPEPVRGLNSDRCPSSTLLITLWSVLKPQPPKLCTPPMLRSGLSVEGGVGLERREKVRAHSLIPKFFLKLFLVATKQHSLFTNAYRDCVGLSLVNCGRTMASTVFLCLKESSTLFI